MIFVCHGFGCKYRVELDLMPSDRAKLAQAADGGQIDRGGGTQGRCGSGRLV